MTSAGDEHVVAVAGDWHGNVSWVQRAIPALARQHPGVRTILHLGDLGIWSGERPPGFLGTLDYWCARSGIDRVLLTPGNHDDWALLDAAFAARPSHAVPLSDHVWALPRGLRFELDGRSFLSFGGAASMDFEARVPGRDWWLQETPTDAEASYAMSGGGVDVLLTHDCVDGGTLEAAEEMKRGHWGAEAQAYSAAARARVTSVWEGVCPRILAHGHMHVKGERQLDDGRRIYSLANEFRAGNLAVLDLRTLNWEWVALPSIERPPLAGRGG
ncbi:hypothetical protein ASE14_09615 [Agromyces sp. Root81]|uniref:metallophosphoesterase family protein n=1 Tax=Agromyces sp. Root81 TaxID=1736601 RepID=UPI0006F2CBB9|nr:metallophosphoesterase [Agromyces sp. Root81]KRC61176.1 hypothetical protein ASE14_09615 [Agromyces sp. Root81]